MNRSRLFNVPFAALAVVRPPHNSVQHVQLLGSVFGLLLSSLGEAYRRGLWHVNTQIREQRPQWMLLGPVVVVNGNYIVPHVTYACPMFMHVCCVLVTKPVMNCRNHALSNRFFLLTIRLGFRLGGL